MAGGRVAVSVRLPVGLVELWRVRADGLGVSRTAFLEGLLRVALEGEGAPVVRVPCSASALVGVDRAEAFRAATSGGSR